MASPISERAIPCRRSVAARATRAYQAPRKMGLVFVSTHAKMSFGKERTVFCYVANELVVTRSVRLIFLHGDPPRHLMPLTTSKVSHRIAWRYLDRKSHRHHYPRSRSRHVCSRYRRPAICETHVVHRSIHHLLRT